MDSFSPIMAVSFHFAESIADLTSSIIIPAALGGVLGVSLVINLILAITVVVLLVKVKCTTNQSPTVISCSKDKIEEAIDIEMNPNELYAGTDENIMTKPNVVYGVTLLTEPTGQSEAYEYVTSK